MTMIEKKTIVREIVETKYESAKAGDQQGERVYTVGYYEHSPFIRMRGKWLEQAGFDTGDRFVVTVKENELVLRKMEAVGD